MTKWSLSVLKVRIRDKLNEKRKRLRQKHKVLDESCLDGLDEGLLNSALPHRCTIPRSAFSFSFHIMFENCFFSQSPVLT